MSCHDALSAQNSTNGRFIGGAPGPAGPPAWLEVRPIAPGDALALRSAFAQLSPESRYNRFHAGISRIPDAMLRHLTQVDGVDHVALVAIEHSADAPAEGVGVGRFVRAKQAPDAAELALTVVDAAQHRGIGRRLLAELSARADERGITHFVMSVLSGNARARQLLSSAGAVGRSLGGGVLAYDVPVSALRA